jgi:hypothetical protein
LEKFQCQYPSLLKMRFLFLQETSILITTQGVFGSAAMVSRGDDTTPDVVADRLNNTVRAFTWWSC